MKLNSSYTIGMKWKYEKVVKDCEKMKKENEKLKTELKGLDFVSTCIINW